MVARKEGGRREGGGRREEGGGRREEEEGVKTNKRANKRAKKGGKICFLFPCPYLSILILCYLLSLSFRDRRWQFYQCKKI